MFAIDHHLPKFDEVVNHLQQEMKGLRTGRATPALVEHIRIEAYNSTMPLMQVSSISTPDPKTIVIQPWDKTLLKAIEKAIFTSDLHLAPIIDKDIVRIILPPMSEENRQNIIKIIHEKAESSRISLRHLREKIRSLIDESERHKDISEDEKFSAQKKLDEIVKKYTEKIRELVDRKERDIMTI